MSIKKKKGGYADEFSKYILGMDPSWNTPYTHTFQLSTDYSAPPYTQSIVVPDPCPVCLQPVQGISNNPTWVMPAKKSALMGIVNPEYVCMTNPCSHRVKTSSQIAYDASGSQYTALRLEADEPLKGVAIAYGVIRKRLLMAAESLPSWTISFRNSQFEMGVDALCPHGGMWHDSLSYILLETAVTDSESIADMVWLGIVNKCAKDHIGKPLQMKNITSQAYGGYADWKTVVPTSFEDAQALVSMELISSYVTASDQMYASLLYGNGASVSSISASGYGESSVVNELAKLCPAIKTTNTTCPDCKQGGTIANLIPHINDHHKWSREKIADWLETLDVDLTLKPVQKELTSGN